jgi:hypothetical protein
MRKPVNNAGSAFGKASFRSRVNQPACCNVKRSRMPGSTDFMPSSAFVGIGKNAMITHTIALAQKP